MAIEDRSRRAPSAICGRYQSVHVFSQDSERRLGLVAFAIRFSRAVTRQAAAQAGEGLRETLTPCRSSHPPDVGLVLLVAFAVHGAVVLPVLLRVVSGDHPVAWRRTTHSAER